MTDTKETEIRKELISIRHSKNENKRQVIRKTLSPSSRFLDNYYNPTAHNKFWKPNGIVMTKKKYNHGETGLFHNYEKNNVLQKSDNQEKNQTTKQQISYLEFDYMENDEVVITIEHCSNCEDHQTHTQHINEIYKKIAKVVQRCILLRFPFIKVYLKPIDTEIINRRIGEQLRSTIIDKNYKEVRIGALEIQCAVKKEDKVTINTIHSKLNSGLWPSINTVLKKIVSLMPRMNLSCIVFDKEEGIRSQSDDNEENLLPSKYENIKVCLYSYRNHQIEELIHYANEELEAIINPKKRKILLSQIKGSQIEQTFRPESSYLPSISNNKTERNIQSRPFTGRSTYTNSVYTTNNIISSRILSANKLSTRPMSSSFGFNKKKNENLNEIIEDKEGIQNSKASFYISTYTKKNGQAIFYNLPYDSYFVEVCDNKTFLHCGNIVKFNKILDTASTNSNEIATLNKFIGLRHQTDAYVEIFIYHNTIPEEYNLQPISGSQVILRRCAENIIDNSFFDDTMNKLIAQENDVEGRHDIVTVPGKYLLEIVKNGYDTVKKEIMLKGGENKINVELNKEKKFKINVIAYNYETNSPLETVQIKVNYSKSDVYEEGLTDSKGAFNFLTVKDDDFITLFAQKEGYYPAQRTFIKEFPEARINVNKEEKKDVLEKNWRVGEHEEIEKDVFIFLVRENFIYESQSILLVVYSNNFSENFEPILDVSPNVINLVTVTPNIQKNKGLLACQINKNDTFNEFDFEKAEEYEEIIKVSLRIKNPELLRYYDIDHKSTVNGLQRFSCEAFIYTTSNIFAIQSPQFSRDKKYSAWEIGFLDIKSELFYELGLLLENLQMKNQFFGEWLNFLQKVIDDKIYAKLFEAFDFHKGILFQNDRFIYDSSFIRSLKTILNIDEGRENQKFSSEFLFYLSDLMKSNHKMISYSILKRKMASNLKNFKIN